MNLTHAGKSLGLLAALLLPGAMQAETVAKYAISDDGKAITETIKGGSWNINGNIGPMMISSPYGNVWRTDGYTTYVDARTGDFVDGQTMSAKICFAIDTNAIVGHDVQDANNVYYDFATCLTGDGGFAFTAHRTGKVGFKVRVGGQLVEIKSDTRVKLWEWNTLQGVVNGNSVKLYLNGQEIGAATASGTGVKVKGADFVLGRDKSRNDAYCQTHQCTFNGAIASVEIKNDATVDAFTAQYANLNLPTDRYKNDKLRAKFHGQPMMNWTNETHGLLYYDNKYHVFFQRTGSAPVMSHAHWGHITSTDLVNWTDERPAIWPTESYDIRGCWSGCVFTDDVIGDGKPTIIYTGVGYGNGESHSAMAVSTDDHMLEWTKAVNPANPIDNYNNTARDTYFFRDGENAYFIIGDEGCMKEYKWNGSGWTANGNFYDFQSGESGFTEMPNVQKLQNGKWLMTYTPYTGSVIARYRIGELSADGKFQNFTEYQKFDCFATDGFGLMSPSIGKDKDGGLVALGIVADKMPTEWNIEKGYAHLYSLPRQISVDNAGNLMQAPFKGHTAMRGTVSKHLDAQTLAGKVALNPVRGRQAEVCATFTVGTSNFGINFLTNSKGKGGKITYNPNNHTVSMDVTSLVSGDYGVKTQSYQLPIYPAAGEDCKLHLFIDHSVCDLFINDRYAASFRVFQEDMGYDLIEVYSDGQTQLKGVDAYMIGEGDMSATPIEPFVYKLPENSGKIAFVKSATPSEQEQAALNFFQRSWPTATVFTADNLTNIPDTYDMVWVHVDRKGLAKGWQNLPAEFKSEAFLTALTGFVAKGGNAMLTGHGTQLTAAIGRVEDKYAPNEFNAGDGGGGSDAWNVLPATNHKIFANMEEGEQEGNKVYGLLQGDNIRREDHNCMWKFGDIAYTATEGRNYEKFEKDTHSKLVGTWGQEKDLNWGGIIEFYPMQNIDSSYGGTVLANGLAACQWAVNGTNNYEKNFELMTANMIAYLADKDGVKPENPGGGEYQEPVVPEIPVSKVKTDKIALYIGYANETELAENAQEKAVYDYFKTAFPEGDILFSNDADKLSLDNYGVIWIHCDREGIAQGWKNLPDAYKNDNVVNRLKEFAKDGGSLYLTKHALQLVNAIGRFNPGVSCFGSGNGEMKHDEWQINTTVDGADNSTHAIYKELTIVNADYGKLITLMSGSHNRQDRNCLWDTGDYNQFANASATILGTWGHNGGQNGIGLVEFNPTEEFAGKIIVNGLAAYEWAPTGGTNKSHANIVKLTTNTLEYLQPAVVKVFTFNVDDAEIDHIPSKGYVDCTHHATKYEEVLTNVIPDGIKGDADLLSKITATVTPRFVKPAVTIDESMTDAEKEETHRTQHYSHWYGEPSVEIDNNGSLHFTANLAGIYRVQLALTGHDVYSDAAATFDIVLKPNFAGMGIDNVAEKEGSDHTSDVRQMYFYSEDGTTDALANAKVYIMHGGKLYYKVTYNETSTPAKKPSNGFYQAQAADQTVPAGYQLYTKNGIDLRNASALDMTLLTNGTRADQRIAFDSAVVTGVNEVEDAELETRWFDLSGVELAEPTVPGVYVKVQGKKAVKVVVK